MDEGRAQLAIEAFARPDGADDTRRSDDGGETLLVTVHVFAEARVARQAQGDVPGLSGLHDEAGPAMTDDHRGLGEQGDEALMGEGLVPLGHRRRSGSAVLDHETHVAMAERRRVDPLHHPFEGMVVGARQGHHEPPHRRGPTRCASG